MKTCVAVVSSILTLVDLMKRRAIQKQSQHSDAACVFFFSFMSLSGLQLDHHSTRVPRGQGIILIISKSYVDTIYTAQKN